ncbi:nucleotidyltransferase family protein [Rhodophyticola sp. CCM32]|uniref:nucleotidyltransferase family protein n=1 Tax=Rhodophyticola sp. CCM32 TaxID=2916397 RepID=UPI0023682D94|nr:nucleotidyltransferase family protein [Rhodophyticola sp. CCM32]
MSSSDPVILLLAAGRATRMRGTDKLLERIDDTPLLTRMAKRCTSAGVTRVILGPDQTARRAALTDIPCQIIEAPEGSGMAASIVAGLADMTGSAALITLADMPEITAHDLHLMLALHAQSPTSILRAASRDGTPGHPVLFPEDLFPDLRKLVGDTGARAVLNAYTNRTHLIPLKDNRALTDLDTPEDWAAWRATQKDGL